MSDAPREARSFEAIRREDLERLAQIAVASFEDLFDRREASRVYRGRLRLLCLCQGAALHLRDGSRGIHDFDIWGFFEPHPDRAFPPRWTPEADFGLSRFGKSPGDQEHEGRKVDVWGRSIEFRPDENAITAVRRWISSGGGRSPGFIRRRPVIVISPGPDFGTWIWPDIERWSGGDA
ncbi:hypothetical protein MKK88_07410 [Methylobacterium sp. E-005]|uniref:hypothetical protein n=1 Tax=Methylobacterium sp. E-005 TaxID=2836549 RepID=UPI001FBB8E8C|nr:hypothetical protein [Methylobacterium sp. E-005]MCJ2085819.1 hypothetical protein [Methylobacterium sp. E-005]